MYFFNRLCMWIGQSNSKHTQSRVLTCFIRSLWNSMPSPYMSCHALFPLVCSKHTHTHTHTSSPLLCSPVLSPLRAAQTWGRNGGPSEFLHLSLRVIPAFIFLLWIYDLRQQESKPGAMRLQGKNTKHACLYRVVFATFSEKRLLRRLKSPKTFFGGARSVCVFCLNVSRCNSQTVCLAN